MQFRGGRFANLPTILIHAPSEKAAMPTSGWSDARKRISKQPTESLAPAEERAKAELNVSSTNYALAGGVISQSALLQPKRKPGPSLRP